MGTAFRSPAFLESYLRSKVPTPLRGITAYGIGNTLAVVGVETTSGYSQAVVQVSNIYNNVGDSIRVLGISSESLQNYNDL